jgi:hypothetical protein
VINPDEARELAARERCTVVSEIEIEEFDLGYIARRRKPPRPDPTLLPSAVGGMLPVIDKETGKITYWPNLGSTGVIEQYREAKSGGQKPAP